MSVLTIGSTIFLLCFLMSLIGVDSESDGVFTVPSRACFDCEANQNDLNFNDCTEQPWRAASITLCKPWQVFCYKYNEVEFCEKLNSTLVKYIRRGCSANLLHKLCIPFFMDCSSYTCYGDYCNGGAVVRTSIFGAAATALTAMAFKAVLPWS